MAREEVRNLVVTRLVMGLTDVQKSILETPVYTGRTLSNFRWSVGSPITSTRAALAEPSLPGKTSDLPLGSEPRRKANAARIQEEFEAILVAVKENPFRQIFLNNNLPHFSDVEYGTYVRDGHQSRTPPGGMTRRGETLLEYDLMGIGKRVEGN
jgi:hypothetical protein